jgi:hypothetical protein
MKPLGMAAVSATMDSFARLPAGCITPELGALERMPLAEFVAGWMTLTGEPPATILDSRSAMLALLVECVPAAPLTPAGAIRRSDGSPCSTRPDAHASGVLPANILTFRPRDGRPSLPASDEDRAAG